MERRSRIARMALSIMPACFLLVLTLTSPVAAFPRSPIALIDTYPLPNDQFGWSVATEGGLVLIGDPYTPEGGNATLFSGQTGAALFGLTSPSLLSLGGGFGWAVALGEGLLIVGAPVESPAGSPLLHSGNVYVFDSGTGHLVFTLTSPHPEFSGFFGGSVSVGDGLIVVSAPEEASGRVYAFNAHSGDLMFSLSNPISSPGFGWSTGVGSERIVVGSPFANPPGLTGGVGEAYIFDSHDGSLLFALLNPMPNNPISYFGGGSFGWSVGSGDGLVVVGAPYDGSLPGPLPRVGPGFAFVFSGQTGGLVSELTNGVAGSQFGSAVALDRGLIGVGAPAERVGNHAGAGGAYIFNARTDELLANVTSANPQTHAVFGQSIAVSRPVIVVGSPFLPGPLSGPGQAYVFPANL